ncbi:MAG: hypothetical protein PHW72_03095 [Candidatus Pacebacteria bacterium]|nr:hypothetical protein [Candidatus Paceibacterota bacterium]
MNRDFLRDLESIYSDLSSLQRELSDCQRKSSKPGGEDNEKSISQASNNLNSALGKLKSFMEDFENKTDRLSRAGGEIKEILDI